MKLLIAALVALLCELQATAQTFKLVRSQSGPSGTVVGSKFVLSEIRSRFVYPQDRALIVYFEWEGPVGEHVLVGHWKSPDGRVVDISADVRMQTLALDFGAYWEYTLRAGLPNGIWTLEVRIDGEPAGSHSFEVVAPDLPAAAPSPQAQAEPPTPTIEEIYDRVKPSLVWVHKIDSLGRRTDTASGFVWAKDRIATAFQTIDGATKLEIEFDDGQRVQSEDIAGLHRAQDWAIIRAPTGDVKPVERGNPADLKVGERALVFNVEGQRVRSMGGVDISGKQIDKVFGPRISYSPALGPDVAGGPLLTLRGAVAAVIGGSRAPGGRFARTGSSGGWNILGWHNESVPISLLEEQPATTLSALLANGSLSPPLVQVPDLVYGGTTRELPKSPLVSMGADVVEFSRTDREIVVFLCGSRKASEIGG